jgi:hypothetical protein
MTALPAPSEVEADTDDVRRVTGRAPTGLPEMLPATPA